MKIPKRVQFVVIIAAIILVEIATLMVCFGISNKQVTFPMYTGSVFCSLLFQAGKKFQDQWRVALSELVGGLVASTLLFYTIQGPNLKISFSEEITIYVFLGAVFITFSYWSFKFLNFLNFLKGFFFSK